MDRFRVAELRAYYGPLLTDKQDDMLRLRYDEDLSFGEIAERYGVSRQAVLDTINKGAKHLEDIDSALGFYARDEKIKRMLNALPSDGEVGAAVKEILRLMEE